MNDRFLNQKTPNEIAQNLADKIKERRKKLKISQSTLAKTLDGLVAFEYDSEWLTTGFSISSFSLPLQKKFFTKI